MRSYTLDEYRHRTKQGPRVAVIGAFDGVHRGHCRLISFARQRAETMGADAEVVVVTFWPLPHAGLASHRHPRLLTTRTHKKGRLAELGVDALITLAFDRSLANMCPAEFAGDILARQLQIDRVCVGFNFTFGRMGSGRPDTLRRLGSQLGFGVDVLPPVTLEGHIVSSTLIRDMIQEGRVHSARRFLGRHYALEGCVVRGKGQGGRTLGFPTANMTVCDMVVLPESGVYVVQVTAPEAGVGAHLGVANVGGSPTFDPLCEDRTPPVETHLVGFSGDLYGAKMTVSFMRRLRGRRAYTSSEELAAQIRADVGTISSLMAQRAVQVFSEPMICR